MLLKPKTRENVGEETESVIEEDSRSLCTPTRSVKINPILQNDPCTIRNMHFLHSTHNSAMTTLKLF